MLRLLSRSPRPQSRQVTGTSLLGVRSALAQSIGPIDAEMPAPELGHTRDDRWLIGSVAAAYRREHDLSERGLADRLGISVEQLFWLQLRTRPAPESARFAADVYRLSVSFQCDADVLEAVLRA